jgi:hypothetical protein
MNDLICAECGTETGHSFLHGLCPRCLFLLAAEDEAEPTKSDLEGAPAAQGEVVRYFGDYELLNEIARGGMGAVFRARQVSLNRIVALKLMLGGEYASRTARERFQNEAEGAAKLQHPNIVGIHEIGSARGQPYFSMDYVDGETLAARIVRQLPPPRQAAEWIHSLAEAVEYAHRQGILHRDLKPQNVMVDRVGRLRITDFGLSKKVDSAERLTISGAVMGTPGYMAPEQAAGNQELIGPATDVYGLGAILYEVLTGRPPFSETTAARTIVKLLEDEPARPSKLSPIVPPDLETIALKCLEKSPAKRYASAQHLAEDLRRFMRGEPITAVPATALRRAGSWCLRHPWVLTGATGGLMITLLAAVYGLWERNRYLMWKASGAPRVESSEVPFAVTMLSMGAGFFCCLGLYALAARRRGRGEILTSKQTAVLGVLGLVQTGLVLLNVLAVTSKAAWGEMKGEPFPLLLSTFLIYLWPGLLLAWDAARGSLSLYQGQTAERPQAGMPRLRINFGAVLAVSFGIALLLDLYARHVIVDRGYEMGIEFRRADLPEGMSSGSVLKWWSWHYEALASYSESIRLTFKMLAMCVAWLPLGAAIWWKDPRGHWRRLLPIAVLTNVLMVAVVFLTRFPVPAGIQWNVLAQAVLLGLLGATGILAAAKVRAITNPAPSTLAGLLSPRSFARWTGLALVTNATLVYFSITRDLAELAPTVAFASALAVLIGATFPHFSRFSTDDKTAVFTAMAAAVYLNPAVLVGIVPAVLIYWLAERDYLGGSSSKVVRQTRI